MKNLPDKIYLATTKKIQNLDSSFVGIAHSEPEDIIEPIEYVRKDVFIEKALEFIKANVDRIVNNQHGVCMGCMDEVIVTTKYKAQKGEEV